MVEESLFCRRKEDRRGEQSHVNPLKATGRRAGPLYSQACQTVLRSATEEEGDGLTDGG